MSSKKNKDKGKGKGKGSQNAEVTERLEASSNSDDSLENTTTDDSEVTSGLEGSAETGSSGDDNGSTSAPVRAHTPRAPLPERMVDKASRAEALVKDVFKVMSERGAPTEVVDASRVLVDQVTNWAFAIRGLKDSGWVPTDPTVKTPIVEGDPIRIVDDEKGIYNFIPGVPEGVAQLVAGPSIVDGKNQVKILVKDPTNGGVYGYIPKRYLDHRR